MKFNINVKRENPIDAKMAKVATKGDLFVTASKRVFIVAQNPNGTEKYFLEVNDLNPVWNLGTKASRDAIKKEAMVKFGAGDYIAIEDIKTSEVSLSVTLKA
jgi:mannose/fructose/N-acetylgalactosamine-specific phosphotransferase system component IIB